MSSKATISKKAERLLHTKSGNRCAMCKAVLVDVGNPFAACVGENAHIYGEKPDAARYDAAKDSSLRESGYSFGVDIKSSRSQGVNYMKVFCYDMVLAELGRARERYPDFLVHDSTIFDGVDERQVARALMLAQLKSSELGFQYICLINSDMIPYQEFDAEFTNQFNESIVLRISDEQEDGGLLGIRF